MSRLPPVPVPAYNVWGLDARAPDDLWISGWLQVAPAFHWDGESWSPVSPSDGVYAGRDNLLLQDGEAWLLADDYDANAAWHLQSGAWSVVELPVSDTGWSEWSAVRQGTDGSVWVTGYHTRLVGRVDSGVFAAEHQAEEMLASLAVVDADEVWAGGYRGLLIRKHEGGWHDVTQPAPVAPGCAVRMPDGRSLFCDTDRLLAHGPEGWEELSTPPPEWHQNWSRSDAIIDASGRLWLSGYQWIAYREADGWVSAGAPAPASRYRLRLDSAGTAWAGDSGARVWRHTGVGWAALPLLASSGRSFHPRGPDDVWAIHEGRAWHFAGQGWSAFEALAEAEVVDIAEGADGSLWFAGDPVQRLWNGEVTAQPGVVADRILIGPGGEVWAYRNPRERPTFRRFDGQAWSDPVASVAGGAVDQPFVAADGALWLYGLDSLYRRPPSLSP